MIRFHKSLRVIATLGAIVGLATTVTAAGASTLGTRVSNSTPRSGGTLNFDQVGLLATPFVPAGPHSASALFPLLRMVYDGLFQVGPKEVIEPELATGYTYSKNGMTLRVDLRHGVKYQDGTPFTAQSVVYNLKAQQNPANGTLCAPLIASIIGYTAPNPFTVDLQLASRDYALPMEFAASNCGDMASPTAEATEGSNFGVTPGPWGSGPFQVTQYTEGTSIGMIKSPTYWNKAHTYVSTVNVSNVGSGSVAYDALLNGSNNLDSSATLSLPNYKQLRNSARFQNLGFPAGNYGYIRFCVTCAPFTNLLARKAVIEATNQKQLINEVFDGIATQVYGPLPPDNFAYDPAAWAAYPHFDLAAAKKLVSQLGGISFTIQIQNVPATVLEYEALQEQWQAAGMTVTLDPLSSTAIENDIHTHNYQVLGFGWGEGQGIDPDAVLTQPFVYGNYADGTFDDPVIQRDIAAGRQLAAPGGRDFYYDKAQMEFAKQLVWDMLPSTNANFIAAKNVHGLFSIGGVINYNGIWIS